MTNDDLLKAVNLVTRKETLLFCSFFECLEMKKTKFPFAWLYQKTKKQQQQLSLFVCSFFATPYDDN